MWWSRSVCLKCPMKSTSYKTQEFRLKSDERWASILILLQTKKISFFSIALCQRTLKCQQPLQQTNGTLFKPHALFLIRQKQAREGQDDRRARRGEKQSKKSLGNKYWETWIEAAICAEDSVAVRSSEKEWPYSSQGEEGTMMMTVCNDFFNVYLLTARQATSCCRKKITNTDFILKEWKTLKIIPVLAIHPKYALTETEIYGSVCP